MFQISRFIEEPKEIFNYFGINIKLPYGIAYIATNKDGKVHGYYEKPISFENGYWGTPMSILLGKIDFMGDSRESLVEVIK